MRISLRRQLLAFGALTLVLPWAGLRIVEETEDALREALETTLVTSARTIANSDELRALLEVLVPVPVPGAAVPIYAHPLAIDPALDGFRADWRFVRDASDGTADSRALELGQDLRVWTGIYGNRLYLFVDVTDDDIVYQSPGAELNGDRVVVLYGEPGPEPRAFLISTAAPSESLLGRPARLGRFVPESGTETRVRAAWRERRAGPDGAGGYSVEISMPLSMLGGRLGVGIVDVDRTSRDPGLGADYAVKLTASWDGEPATAPLIREWPVLERLLADLTVGGARFRVLSEDGWVLADTGSLAPAAVPSEPRGMPLAERFFRFLLGRDDPGYAATFENPPGRLGDPVLRAALAGEARTAWYSQGIGDSAIVAAAVGIESRPGGELGAASGAASGERAGLGAVLVEQASDSVLTTTNAAMMRLMSTTVLVSLAAALALLAYASFLSFRVGRLARAAESALGPRGEINAKLPGARAGDEIGDLSRSFENLLGRLREYTDYLKTLKSKLSHELRTPLAIVSTSLDNLEQEPGSESAGAYRARLRHGIERLESILQAMTAATRVEQAITQTETEPFDLVRVVESCRAAYGDVYPNRRFAATLPAEPVLVEGSAELIEQMLDKLVDNAASFAAPGTPIEIELGAGEGEARLTVRNRGPLLPSTMRHQLFDSLVSVRESRGEKPHLGLGLYIVTLIAEFHGGRVEADNLPDASGVMVSVMLPRPKKGSDAFFSA